MASFLEAVSVIGGMGSDNPTGSFKALVKGQATSVSAAMALMTHPHPEQWIQRDIPRGAISGWTQAIEGVASDGALWYFSSNGSDNPTGTSLQGIHRFDLATGAPAPPFLLQRDFQGVHFGLKSPGDFESHLGPPSNRCHFGGIDIRDGEILVAIESPMGMLAMDAMTGALLMFTTLKNANGTEEPLPQKDNPWCAFNPLNRLVYTSDFNADEAPGGTVHAYDPDKDFRHVPAADIHIDEFPAKIQGGCFSPDGHLFLSSDHRDGPNHFIHVYSALSGVRFGALTVTALESSQEMEGICYFPVTMEDRLWKVHAVLLDTHKVQPDTMFFKHYAAGA